MCTVLPEPLVITGAHCLVWDAGWPGRSSGPLPTHWADADGQAARLGASSWTKGQRKHCLITLEVWNLHNYKKCKRQNKHNYYVMNSICMHRICKCTSYGDLYNGEYRYFCAVILTCSSVIFFALSLSSCSSWSLTSKRMWWTSCSLNVISNSSKINIHHN